MAISTSIEKISIPFALLVGAIVGTWGFSRSIVTAQDLKTALESERVSAVVALGPLIDAKIAPLNSAVGVLSDKVGNLSERVAVLQGLPR